MSEKLEILEHWNKCECGEKVYFFGISTHQYSKLEAENARYKEALAFYADENLYMDFDCSGADIDNDRGEKARDALRDGYEKSE